MPKPKTKKAQKPKNVMPGFQCSFFFFLSGANALLYPTLSSYLTHSIKGTAQCRFCDCGLLVEDACCLKYGRALNFFLCCRPLAGVYAVQMEGTLGGAIKAQRRSHRKRTVINQ